MASGLEMTWIDSAVSWSATRLICRITAIECQSQGGIIGCTSVVAAVREQLQKACDAVQADDVALRDLATTFRSLSSERSPSTAQGVLDGLESPLDGLVR